MRFSKTIFLGVLFLIVVIASGETTMETGYLEYSLITDYSGSGTNDFIVTATENARWDRDYFLTTDYSDASLIDIPEQSDLNEFPTYGWNFVDSATPTGTLTIQYSDLCFGLYKIVRTKVFETYTQVDSFYFDLRDDRIGTPVIYPGNDGYIRFIESNSPKFSCKTIKNTTTIWINLDNGTTIGVWDMLEATGSPSQQKFQPTDPSNLQISSSDGHPYLTWNASTEPAGVAKYNVWRKSDSYFYKITSDISTTSFLDDEVTANRFSSTVYSYYVTAVSGDGLIESNGQTSTKTFVGDGPLEKAAVTRDGVNIPIGYHLSNAYPNPFNPMTSIRYSLPGLSKVRISIYDTAGRKIRSLVNSDQVTGEYEVRWDGTDQSGNNVAGGMYFARLETSGYSSAIKVIYMK